MTKTKWTSKKLEPSPKKRKKYITRRIRVNRFKWGLIIALTILAGTFMYYYPEYVYSEIINSQPIDNKISNEEIKSEIKNCEGLNNEVITATYAPINGNWSKEQLDIRTRTEIKIRQIAKECNFQYTDYLVKLADCESMLGLKLTNAQGNNPATSVDRGIFQFNSHWQKRVSDECAYDTNCATRKAIEMINNGSQVLWVCDKIVKGKTNFR